MGMFDNIICRAPIVGGLPPWIGKHPFQTKDLDCELDTYIIAEDGTFSRADFSGTLQFYSSNVVGSGPGLYTQNGEDAEYIECKAIFLHGKLVEPIAVQRKSEPAWPSARQTNFSYGESECTKDEQARRYREHLEGKRIYVLWGGEDKGYWAKVIAENDRQLCVSHEAESKYHRAGDFEIIDRRDRDRIFWDSEEEALSRHRMRQSAWQAEVQAFEAYKIERASKLNKVYNK